MNLLGDGIGALVPLLIALLLVRRDGIVNYSLYPTGCEMLLQFIPSGAANREEMEHVRLPIGYLGENDSRILDVLQVITAWPKTLHVVTVGSVTSPVTQVAVVAVNSASKYGTASPLAELIGSTSSRLPTKITIRKLSIIICVVERENFFFIISNTLIVAISFRFQHIRPMFPEKSTREPTVSAVNWFP